MCDFSKFRLGKSELEIADSLDILGVNFDSKLTYSKHAEKRISCCRRSYYGLSDIGMCYPGLPTDVKCHLWRSICVPSLVYGFDAISINTSLQLKLESVQGSLIKQGLGLYKTCHFTSLLQALDIKPIREVVDNRRLCLFNQIFMSDSPANVLNSYMLSSYITKGIIIQGTLLSHVINMNVSPIKAAFKKMKKCVSQYSNGLVDSIKHVVFSEEYMKPHSTEHSILNLLLRSF